MNRSLRLRLLLNTSLASAVVLAVLGFSIYGFMWHLLQRQFDDGLLTKAKAIAAMVEQHGPVVNFDADLDQMPEFNAGRHAEYFEVWLSDGRVLARSASMLGTDLRRPAVSSSPQSSDADLPDGRPARFLSLSFPPRVEHDEDDVGKPTPAKLATVLVAARPREMHETLELLQWLLLTLCSGAVIASGMVLYRLVGQAVRPVKQLAGHIESLRETELDKRLESRGVPRELMPVVDRLNGLLGRLQDSFEREKSFTADVAHELRTPLAGLATTLEVCRSRPRQSVEYESVIDDCRAMTDRMRAMTESLLMLARAEAGQLRVEQQNIDLVALIENCWEAFDGRAKSRGLVVERRLPSRCEARTDPDKLRIVLNNLLDNAVSYTNDGGTIGLAVIEESPGTIIFEVSNTGAQISNDDLPKLFDRFYRGDQARSDTGVHSGLGLSLCRRLTGLMQETLTVHTSPTGKFFARTSIRRSRP